MNALTPLAVANADVLRALHSDKPESIAECARLVNRDKDNLRKTIKAMQAAGLLSDRAPVPGLSGRGAAALEAIDRAENPLLASEGDAGTALLLHSQLQPHPLNPRKDFDSEEAREDLDALRESILERGLKQPLLVRPRAEAPGHFWIVAGERRWRAIGEAIDQGDWADNKTFRCTIEEMSDDEHALDALLENMIRRDLSPIEEAYGFKGLRERGRSNAEIADMVKRTPEFVQQRFGLLKLSADDQARMRLPKDNADHLNFKEARKLFQTPKPKAAIPPAVQLAAIELAHKIGAEGVVRDDAPGIDGAAAERWAIVNGYGYMSDTWKALGLLGLCVELLSEVAGVNCCLAALTDEGLAFCAEAYPEGVSEEALRAAQEEIGRQDKHPGAGEDEGYFTYVLNAGTTAPRIRESQRIRANLTPLHHLMLVEVAHKAQFDPAPKAYGDWTALIGAGQDLPTTQSPARTDLSIARLISFTHGRSGDAVRILPAGLEAIVAAGYGEVPGLDLNALQAATGNNPAAGARYTSVWLTDAPKPDKPAPSTSHLPAERIVGPSPTLPLEQPALIPLTPEEQAAADQLKLAGQHEQIDEGAVNDLMDELYTRLAETHGKAEGRWHHQSLFNLADEAVAAVQGGRIIDAVIAIMGLIQRESGDINSAGRDLEHAARCEPPSDLPDPYGALVVSAERVRDFMVRDLEPCSKAFGIAETIYPPFATALSAISWREKSKAQQPATPETDAEDA